MSVKITQLQAENFKRVRAVQVEPAATGLTIVGGDNNQGKTSVLDAVAWTLGGDRFRPSHPTREGSVIPPHITVQLSNGLTVERTGKNGSLKVTDPSGQRGGQQLLNEFVESFALDLPKFMQASGKDKAQTLLRILGIGERLEELERREKEAYNERLAVGRIAEQKRGHAKDMPFWEGVPQEPVSAAELIRQQQEILARNGENRRLRQRRDELRIELDHAFAVLDEAQRRVETLQDSYDVACMNAQDLQDESTAELEANLREIDAINVKVRQNREKAQAEADAGAMEDQYAELTAKVEAIRSERLALLDKANMPLPGLSVEGGELTYHGQHWDNMSGSEQLRVAAAIVRRLNPECGFVLLDKLEQMDMNTLREFGAWLETEGLQAIATRVSTGDECSIIIEDGYIKDAAQPAPATWTEGVF